MSKVKIKLNGAGVRELLKEQAVSEFCKGKAEEARGRAGDGYEVSKRAYPDRTGYAIRPTNIKAYRSNLKNNTLVKAVR